jgi:AbrB family looped-hinge helix DNA binding protein
MFKENLINLRKLHHLTQEELAEKLGISRQSIAKWETGETSPDLEKCRKMAQIFGVSLDDLANYEKQDNFGLEVPPKGKHFFGTVKIDENGQIVIPEKARKIFGLDTDTELVLLGDEASGLALMKLTDLMNLSKLMAKTTN